MEHFRNNISPYYSINEYNQKWNIEETEEDIVYRWLHRCSAEGDDLINLNREVIIQGPMDEVEDHTLPLIVFLNLKSEDKNFEPNIDYVYLIVEKIQSILIDRYACVEDNINCFVTKTTYPYYRSGFYNHLIRLQFPDARFTSIDEFSDDIERELLRELHFEDESIKWNRIVFINRSTDVLIMGSAYSGTYEEFITVLPYQFKDKITEINTFDDLSATFKDVLNLYVGTENEHYGFEKYCHMFDGLSPERLVPIYLSLHYRINKLTLDRNTYDKVYNVDVDNTMDLHELEDAFIEAIDMSYRMNNLQYWTLIGRALKTNSNKLRIIDNDIIFNKNEMSIDNALAKWENYTMLHSKKFSPKDCVKYWNTFKNNDYISIKTLAWFAKKDNPIRYEEIMLKWTLNDIINIIQHDGKPTDVKLGTLFYKMYFMDLIGDPNYNSGHWYYYDGNKWKFEATDSFAINYMNKMLQNIRTTLEFYSVNEKTLKEISCLENISKINSALKASRSKLNDDSFLQYADTNKDILVYNNVTLECVGDKVVFRETMPEDYNTSVIDITYEKINKDSDLYIEFRDWMDKMYPEEGMYDYMMKLFASCLKGGNNQKMLPILVSGESILNNNVGNEGKTTLKTLVSEIFGKYSTEPSYSAIATANISGGEKPKPELSNIRNKRVVWFSEPPTGMLIDDGIIKLITGGNERINARKLHSNDTEFEVTCVPFFICNDIPQFARVDTALKNRIRIIPHFSRWVREEEYNLYSEEEAIEKRLYLLDEQFDPKIYGNVLLNVLSEYYEKYIKEGLKEPTVIKDFTKKYWSSIDPCRRWFNERVYIEVGERIKDSDAYKDYCNWCYTNQVKPIERIRSYFDKNLVTIINDIDEGIIYKKPFYINMTTINPAQGFQL